MVEGHKRNKQMNQLHLSLVHENAAKIMYVNNSLKVSGVLQKRAISVW